MIGHEIAGEVLTLGEGVTGWRAGDRVAVCPTASPSIPGYTRDRGTPFCPQCRSQKVGWTKLSGQAEVFPVMHGFPGLADVIIVAAVLDLPDAPGARLVSNIVDCDPEKIAIGDQVQVFFSPIADGWKIPLFRLAS